MEVHCSSHCTGFAIGDTKVLQSTIYTFPFLALEYIECAYTISTDATFLAETKMSKYKPPKQQVHYTMRC